MRFRYSSSDAAQDPLDSLPWLPLVLRSGNRAVQVVALVDSGATVNVLPHKIGIQLGAIWDDEAADIPLAGAFGSETAVPLFAMAEIEGLPTVRLAFAWARTNEVPLILGQTNFFVEFDICFYRSRLEFDLVPKSRA
jgi:hypothetical protein